MHTIEINFNNLDFWQEHIPNHVMALGFFDGLHKGHREVIKTAKEVAIAKQLPMSVMSFFLILKVFYLMVKNKSII